MSVAKNTFHKDGSQKLDGNSCLNIVGGGDQQLSNEKEAKNRVIHDYSSSHRFIRFDSTELFTKALPKCCKNQVMS